MFEFDRIVVKQKILPALHCNDQVFSAHYLQFSTNTFQILE